MGQLRASIPCCPGYRPTILSLIPSPVDKDPSTLGVTNSSANAMVLSKSSRLSLLDQIPTPLVPQKHLNTQPELSGQESLEAGDSRAMMIHETLEVGPNPSILQPE